MPLLVGASPTGSPLTPATTPGRVAERVGTIRATWIDPDGMVWELSGPHEMYGWLTTPAVAGWGAGPVTVVTDPVARGGVEVRHVRPEPRRITWPLHIYGDTHMQWLTRYRDLMRAFTKTRLRRRPGTLQVARPDGAVRQIDAWYEDGFGGEAGENWVSANPVLTLFCPDGFWRDANPVTVRRDNVVDDGAVFLDPFLTVSSGQALGDTTIVNDGDDHGWPVWTFTGPAVAVTATNRTLGASFTVTYNLQAGQTITVDTGTHRPTIRGPAGQNLAGSLNWPQAELWPLEPGVNDITFLMEGAGAGSSVEMVFHRRYESS